MRIWCFLVALFYSVGNAFAEEGEVLYQTGLGLEAQFVGTSLVLEGRNFPCANCHGPLAQGRIEGGIEMPALSQSALSRKYGGEGDGALAVFTALVRDGLRPDGTSLASAMPRFRISDEDSAAIFAYLGELEAESGLESQKIWLKYPKSPPAILPFRAGLRTCAAEIYGREFDLRDNGLLNDGDYKNIGAALAVAEYTVLDERFAGERVKFLEEKDRVLLPSTVADRNATILFVGDNRNFSDDATKLVGRAVNASLYIERLESGVVSTMSEAALAFALQNTLAPDEAVYFDIGSIICEAFLRAGRRANLDEVRGFINATEFTNYVALASW